MFKGGYTGSILRVNLSTLKISEDSVTVELARNFIGGMGFCMRLLYCETGPQTKPLSPENKLVFAVGPLNGTIFPSASRYVVAAKSPATGLIGYANSGGFFASELKFAGYDAIVISGRAKQPVYLWINDGYAEIRKADHIWGKDTWKTEDILRKELRDPKTRIACIGQAGENLVSYSGIISEKSRAAARCGLGAVAGYKKLKAIAVRGSKKVDVATPDRFKELVSELLRKLIKSSSIVTKRKYGTAALVNIMNEIGRFPTYNHQKGVYPKAEKISAEAIVEKYKIGQCGCYGCIVNCNNLLKLKSGPHAGLSGDQPEYETLCGLGSQLGIDDLDFIIYCNWLCDQYGLDTISTGATIAFAMELWEKGIIDEEDTGGLNFVWGNKETVEKTIHLIAKREGFGKILSEGVKKAAEKIRKGSGRYAMHVKGLEIPGQDGRAQKSMGIAHATASRGADHLTHCTMLDESGIFENAIKDRFGEKYLPEMANRLESKYKGIMAKECETATAVVNSLVTCIGAGSMSPPIYYWREITDAYRLVTGIELTIEEMRKAGERIAVIRRAYNIREGLDRSDDTLPKRFLEEPAPEGPCKGQIVELNEMLKEYYEAWGYDNKTGWIPKARLVEFGLEDVMQELESLGRIP